MGQKKNRGDSLTSRRKSRKWWTTTEQGNHSKAVLLSQSVRGNWGFDRAAIPISVRLIICELSHTVHDSCSREFMLHYF